MKKRHVVLLHLFYWLLRFTWEELHDILFIHGHHIDWAGFVTPLSIGEYIVFMAPFYINYCFIMPYYFKQNKMLKSWGSWLLLLFFFISFRYFIEEYLFAIWFNSHNYKPGVSKIYYAFDNVYFGTTTIMASIFLWATVNWKKLEGKIVALAKEKNEAELNFLKSQVNPHFLFNTLNNIYSLVYHKSDKAMPAILKLSELMRFMTTESSSNKIDLDKEIQYIESFIELESLRTQDDTVINFSVNGDTAGKKIAPLLLIPFIENGFKHGVVTDKANPFVIQITIKGNDFNLFVSNKINNHQKNSISGIGLNNVRKRLELLYGGKYTLDIGEEDDAYICNLGVKL